MRGVKRSGRAVTQSSATENEKQREEKQRSGSGLTGGPLTVSHKGGGGKQLSPFLYQERKYILSHNTGIPILLPEQHQLEQHD